MFARDRVDGVAWRRPPIACVRFALVLVLAGAHASFGSAAAPTERSAQWQRVFQQYVQDPAAHRRDLLRLGRRDTAGLQPLYRLALADAHMRSGHLRTAARMFGDIAAEEPGEPWQGFAAAGGGLGVVDPRRPRTRTELLRERVGGRRRDRCPRRLRACGRATMPARRRRSRARRPTIRADVSPTTPATATRLRSGTAAIATAPPRRCASYSPPSLGLVPSEHSTCGLKSTSVHARRVSIEAAWHARHRPAVGAKLRQRGTGQPGWVLALADRAQARLHRRYWRFLQRGKPHNVAVTAVARELVGFLWATLLLRDHSGQPAERPKQRRGRRHAA